MPSGRKVAMALLGATIAAVLLNPLAAAVAGSTGTTTVSNETVTADVGNYSDLDGYDIVSDSETVLNSSGDVMTKGTDYKMAYENGSIKPLAGGDIGDGTQMDVSYEYRVTSGTTSTVIELVTLFAGLLILGTLAFKVSDMM